MVPQAGGMPASLTGSYHRFEDAGRQRQPIGSPWSDEKQVFSAMFGDHA